MHQILSSGVRRFIMIMLEDVAIKSGSCSIAPAIQMVVFAKNLEQVTVMEARIMEIVTSMKVTRVIGMMLD